MSIVFERNLQILLDIIESYMNYKPRIPARGKGLRQEGVGGPTGITKLHHFFTLISTNKH
jgi:hypothetical protein